MIIKIAQLLLFISLISWPAHSQVKSFEVLTPRVEQGELVVVKIHPLFKAPAHRGASISIFDKYYLPNEEGYVFIGVSAYTKPGKYTARLVEYGRGINLSSDVIDIEVIENNFQKTRTAGSGPSSRPRKQSERTAINYAFDLNNKTGYDLTGGWRYVPPLQNVLKTNVIDPFGLIYRNIATLIHNGADFKAFVGTPVRAINRSEVVLVANDYSKEGNMIILYHGLDTFSVYMHLSKINVTQGQLINRGNIIGLTGDTGAGVREPHLHFSIKVNDDYIDPMSFMETINPHLK